VNYHVVFDASQNASQVGLFLFPPLFALVFGFIGWAVKNSGDPQWLAKGTFFMVISALGLGLSLVFLVSQLNKYHRAKKALETGNYQVAEGTVSDFVPMPPGGHSIEHFRVAGSAFQYGSGWGSVVFNSEWNRGDIRNGAQVRIAYSDGNILRVEVK
jgi:hypothetical protein